MYTPPNIESGAGIARKLKDIPGSVLVTTMDIPWAVFSKQVSWTPANICQVQDMDLSTLETLEKDLPPCDVVVGIGGGSCCDTAKYLAWKRGIRMILVPTITSVDAPLTNTVAVRVDKAVRYVGDLYPQELLIDHDLIRAADPALNRAGAADILSIHTALFDWPLAHKDRGEAYYEDVAREAAACLVDLEQNADEIRGVTPKGIDTIIDLFRREVEFCARIGTSRPEEGSEHLIAYNIEHITRRHFVHGDLVALGIHIMTRVQENRHDWSVQIMDRLGLRYRVPGVTRDELRQCLTTLRAFVKEKQFFYSCVDTPLYDALDIDVAIDSIFQ